MSFTIIVLLMFTFIALVSYQFGWQAGQVEALNGKQHFEMVTNTSTSVHWHQKN